MPKCQAFACRNEAAKAIDRAQPILNGTITFTYYACSNECLDDLRRLAVTYGGTFSAPRDIG